MAERDIKNEIQLALSHDDTRLFKFQCGNFQLIDGRWISVGIPGMSDLMGWTEVTITPDMVGRKVPVFTSLEVKADKGRVRSAQLAWLTAVDAAGVIAGVARSVDDASDIISRGTERLRGR